MAMASPARSGLTHPLSNSPVSNSSHAGVRADLTSRDSFPAGLRVLVVDDDPICLLILDRMLRHCKYQVTTCGRAMEALAMLRENRNSFDVIISDVYMPDMDGFKLLELVGLEMDLPVIMMSANGETSAVMKGIKHGACDYLLKPVRMEELRNIWQHVMRKQWRSSGQTTSHEVDNSRQAVDDGEHTSSANEGADGTWKQSKKRKDMKEEEEDVDPESDDPSSTKKPRVVWSVELHQQFVNAVNQLGIDKAVPKRILELMSVQGLTRENVASHLQKYRLYLRRISAVSHQSAGGLSSSFPLGTDSNFGAVNPTGFNALNELRTLGGPSPTLVSSLQAGIIGRLNPTSLGMTNLDPSVLYRIAALQGAGHGAMARPSPGQSMSNVQGSFQTGLSDINQLQGSSHVGAFAGSLDKGLPQLSVLQQQQVAAMAMASLGEFQQLPGVGHKPQLVNVNGNALLMQSLQQQQQRSAGHLTTTDPLTMPPKNGGMGVQQGLSVDTGESLALPTLNVNTGHSSGSLRQMSASSLVTSSASALGCSNGRATDLNNGAHFSITGNMNCLNPTTFPSPLASSVLDELSPQINDSGSSLASQPEALRQAHGPKYASFAGLKQEQDFHQRSHGSWQAVDMGQDHGQLNDQCIQNSSYSQACSRGQDLIGEAGIPSFGTGYPDNSGISSAHLRALLGDNNLKVKEEGHMWLHEPLSDELLTIILKQQEGLGLAENELGGPEGYVLDNMYVK